MASDGTDPRPVAAPLPEGVRPRVLVLAAEALTAIPEAGLTPALRSVRRFTPSRRVRLGGSALAAGLESDPVFRQGVAEHVRRQAPDLSAAMEGGSPPAAADPVEVAAVAYILRPTGWEALVAAGGAVAERAAADAGDQRLAETVVRLQEQLSAVRAQGRSDLERLRAERDELRAELADVRRALRESQQAARRATERLEAAEQELTQARAEARVTTAAADSELRRLRRELAGVEANLETTRRAERAGRSLGTARARLLLDVLGEAAAGLARELALPASDLRPADVVDAVTAEEPGVGDVAARALAADDPGLLDQLLALPRVHLVVDGYNVTKTGYGTLPLEDQRARLVSGLATLAGQTGAEVTCCFDGSQGGSAILAGPSRGVRVLFSHADEIADELIRRLVANEPSGRPVVVVSSDREVADGVRRTGARPVPATALLRRLERS